MIIYLSLIISAGFFSFLELFTNIIKRKYFKLLQNIYIFTLFLLFIFNRDNNDYQNYRAIFETGSKRIEKGYIFLNYIVKSIGLDYNHILLILGILFIFVFFLFI